MSPAQLDSETAYTHSKHACMHPDVHNGRFYSLSLFISPVAPVVNRVTFPPVVQAGKEETIYTTIAVKPLPAILPSLNVTLTCMHSNGSSTIDAISAWTTPSPSNSIEYIILHTFTVPLEVDCVTFVFLRIDLPNDQVWRNIDNSQLAIGDIGIIFPGERHTYL